MNNNNKSLLRTLAIMLLAFVQYGCATTPGSASDATALQTSATNAPEHLMYQVKPGDSLTLIARRITGNQEHWKDIAAANTIDNPRRLAAGSLVRIPAHLIPNLGTLYNSSPAQRQLQSVSLTPSRSTMPATTDRGAGIRVSRATVEEDIAPITLTPVNINRQFVLEPIGSYTLRTSARVSDITTLPRIRVRGTFTPKAIYAQPANYSALVTRAAPGAVFELEKEVNDWYKIRTDRGVGYIRRHDGYRVK